MKLLTIIISIVLIISCNKDDKLTPPTELPFCIMLEVGQNPNLSVYINDLDGDFHYWLNTGARAFDGNEDIVDTNCNVVCYFGGWINPPCIDDYNEEWVQIWPE